MAYMSVWQGEEWRVKRQGKNVVWHFLLWAKFTVISCQVGWRPQNKSHHAPRIDPAFGRWGDDLREPFSNRRGLKTKGGKKKVKCQKVELGKITTHSSRRKCRFIKHDQPWHSGLPFSHLQHLKSRSTFLCTLSWIGTKASEGKKWFSNKGYSLCEQPWVLPCLSKASAVVKKTDSCSLSTWFCVMTHIIYLVASMTTVREAWCMGFLNAPTTPFSL